MATLQEHRKKKFRTMKDFAQAFGCGPGKATTLLQGRHSLAISDNEMRKLATTLGISFDECTKAMSESYDEWHNKEQKKPAIIHQAIKVVRFTNPDDFFQFLTGKDG